MVGGESPGDSQLKVALHMPLLGISNHIRFRGVITVRVAFFLLGTDDGGVLGAAGLVVDCE